MEKINTESMEMLQRFVYQVEASQGYGPDW